MNKSGKCPHELLIVHSDGVWFVATCKECKIAGPKGETPADARAKFDRRRGERPASRRKRGLVQTALDFN